MLDLCDRYGIFVEDEAPVCWESGKDSYDRISQIFYGFKSMVVRDRTHPCILLWSLGNESEWKPKFYNNLLLAKELASGIPVKFSHSETHGIIKATDIGTKHYPGWKGLMAFENIRGSPPSELLQYFREHNRSGTKRYVGRLS